ncbi:uncharacterized protein LY89DRAFT_690519 [Mollisia scopiformis]|uniref:Uncharacterized protein n=1 Tax=Mollisia scopiformis TaxID=149040 RepID=A0A132B971_MOLSC|nr:uncharacterized protein LY89DRAFT_690519 [Mollisia scopiformis]KUJ08948.1 hypothetical protein LY89DRAFT_690519 [Mollisia scopiformis]
MTVVFGIFGIWMVLLQTKSTCVDSLCASNTRLDIFCTTVLHCPIVPRGNATFQARKLCTRHNSYNANAKTKAESKANDQLTIFPEAPLVGAVVEDVLDPFEEEVLEAVPFEAADDTELVNVVDAPVEEDVLEKVALGVDWTTVMVDEPDVVVDTVPLPVADVDAELDGEATELVTELLVVLEEVSPPPVMWNGNDSWNSVIGLPSRVRFKP